MITARRQILRALLEPPDAAAGNLKSALPSGVCFRHEAEAFSDNFRLAAACRALQLVKDLAIQVVALKPLYPTIESIPAEALAAKQAELLADESVQKKPENIRPQIVDGQLKKWYQQVVLTEQPYRDTDQTIGELITSAIATIGENIKVRRFVRFEVGEEL